MTAFDFSRFRVSALALAAALLAFAPEAHAARAYIGTYTPPPGGGRSDANGEGIYLVDVDDATGVPSKPRLVAKAYSPSWLTVSEDGKYLYAVNETSSYPGKSGGVSAYAIDPQTGDLALINTVSSQGAGPCHLSLHASGKYLLVANYAGGTFSVFKIERNGVIGEATHVIAPGGPLSTEPAAQNPPGQFQRSDHSASHAHMIGPDPTGQYVIGDDAGRDQIFVWKMDEATDKLVEQSVTKSPPGSAPRHFVFSPDGKRMYQLQEQDSRLAVYDFAGGKLTQKGDTVSALPDGYEGSSIASELLISRDGRFIYFGNRGQDSIGVFAADANGVKRIANVSTEGNNPRSLTLDPTGKFLYSLNQRVDHVTTFRIGADGIPKFTGKYMGIGSPAVMAFLPEAK